MILEYVITLLLLNRALQRSLYFFRAIESRTNVRHSSFHRLTSKLEKACRHISCAVYNEPRLPSGLPSDQHVFSNTYSQYPMRRVSFNADRTANLEDQLEAYSAYR